jgi:hypothetical protein
MIHGVEILLCMIRLLIFHAWAVDKEASVVLYLGRSGVEESVLESYILMSLSGLGGE